MLRNDKNLTIFLFSIIKPVSISTRNCIYSKNTAVYNIHYWMWAKQSWLSPCAVKVYILCCGSKTGGTMGYTTWEQCWKISDSWFELFLGCFLFWNLLLLSHFSWHPHTHVDLPLSGEAVECDCFLLWSPLYSCSCSASPPLFPPWLGVYSLGWPWTACVAEASHELLILLL